MEPVIEEVTKSAKNSLESQFVDRPRIFDEVILQDSINAANQDWIPSWRRLNTQDQINVLKQLMQWDSIYFTYIFIGALRDDLSRLHENDAIPHSLWKSMLEVFSGNIFPAATNIHFPPEGIAIIWNSLDETAQRQWFERERRGSLFAELLPLTNALNTSLILSEIVRTHGRSVFSETLENTNDEIELLISVDEETRNIILPQNGSERLAELQRLFKDSNLLHRLSLLGIVSENEQIELWRKLDAQGMRLILWGINYVARQHQAQAGESRFSNDFRNNILLDRLIRATPETELWKLAYALAAIETAEYMDPQIIELNTQRWNTRYGNREVFEQIWNDLRARETNIRNTLYPEEGHPDTFHASNEILALIPDNDFHSFWAELVESGQDQIVLSRANSLVHVNILNRLNADELQAALDLLELNLDLNDRIQLLLATPRNNERYSNIRQELEINLLPQQPELLEGQPHLEVDFFLALSNEGQASYWQSLSPDRRGALWTLDPPRLFNALNQTDRGFIANQMRNMTRKEHINMLFNPYVQTDVYWNRIGNVYRNNNEGIEAQREVWRTLALNLTIEERNSDSNEAAARRAVATAEATQLFSILQTLDNESRISLWEIVLEPEDRQNFAQNLGGALPAHLLHLFRSDPIILSEILGLYDDSTPLFEIGQLVEAMTLLPTYATGNNTLSNMVAEPDNFIETEIQENSSRRNQDLPNLEDFFRNFIDLLSEHESVREQFFSQLISDDLSRTARLFIVLGQLHTTPMHEETVARDWDLDLDRQQAVRQYFNPHSFQRLLAHFALREHGTAFIDAMPQSYINSNYGVQLLHCINQLSQRALDIAESSEMPALARTWAERLTHAMPTEVLVPAAGNQNCFLRDVYRESFDHFGEDQEVFVLANMYRENPKNFLIFLNRVFETYGQITIQRFHEALPIEHQIKVFHNLLPRHRENILQGDENDFFRGGHRHYFRAFLSGLGVDDAITLFRNTNISEEKSILGFLSRDTRASLLSHMASTSPDALNRIFPSLSPEQQREAVFDNEPIERNVLLNQLTNRNLDSFLANLNQANRQSLANEMTDIDPMTLDENQFRHLNTAVTAIFSRVGSAAADFIGSLPPINRVNLLITLGDGLQDVFRKKIMDDNEIPVEHLVNLVRDSFSIDTGPDEPALLNSFFPLLHLDRQVEILFRLDSSQHFYDQPSDRSYLLMNLEDQHLDALINYLDQDQITLLTTEMAHADQEILIENISPQNRLNLLEGMPNEIQHDFWDRLHPGVQLGVLAEWELSIRIPFIVARSVQTRETLFNAVPIDDQVHGFASIESSEFRMMLLSAMSSSHLEKLSHAAQQEEQEKRITDEVKLKRLKEIKSRLLTIRGFDNEISEPKSSIPEEQREEQIPEDVIEPKEPRAGTSHISEHDAGSQEVSEVGEERKLPSSLSSVEGILEPKQPLASETQISDQDTVAQESSRVREETPTTRDIEPATLMPEQVISSSVVDLREERSEITAPEAPKSRQSDLGGHIAEQVQLPANDGIEAIEQLVSQTSDQGTVAQKDTIESPKTHSKDLRSSHVEPPAETAHNTEAIIQQESRRPSLIRRWIRRALPRRANEAVQPGVGLPATSTTTDQQTEIEGTSRLQRLRKKAKRVLHINVVELPEHAIPDLARATLFSKEPINLQDFFQEILRKNKIDSTSTSNRSSMEKAHYLPGVEHIEDSVAAAIKGSHAYRILSKANPGVQFEPMEASNGKLELPSKSCIDLITINNGTKEQKYLLFHLNGQKNLGYVLANTIPNVYLKEITDAADNRRKKEENYGYEDLYLPHRRFSRQPISQSDVEATIRSSSQESLPEKSIERKKSAGKGRRN